MDKNAERVRQRRVKVWKMRQEGLGQTEIGLELDAMPQTIQKDFDYLDDCEMLQQSISAEQPIVPTKDAAIDAMQEQLRSLRLAQSRFHPASREWLKRNEPISWLALKIAELSAKLPNRGKPEPSAYNFTCTMPGPLTVDLSVVAPDSIAMSFGDRVKPLECPVCHGNVNVCYTLVDSPKRVFGVIDDIDEDEAEDSPTATV